MNNDKLNGFQITGNHEVIGGISQENTNTFQSLNVKEEKQDVSSGVVENDYQQMYDYFRSLMTSEEYHIAFMERTSNSIIYGEYIDGFQEEVGRFSVQKDSDLKRLYELLQIEFADTFKVGCTHSSCYGWSLLPSISNYLLVKIGSRTQYDRNWIYEEVRKINDSKNNNVSLNK